MNQPDTLKTGIELIADERATHEARGWTAMHDDEEHPDGQIIEAAMVYCHRASALQEGGSASDTTYVPEESYPFWPWEMSSLRLPADPIRSLTKAAALIAAEIDRPLRIKDRGIL